MTIKIERGTTRKLPRNLEPLIDRLLSTLPREHLRGIERIRLVDTISDPRLRVPTTVAVPGLYHPKQAGQSAWLEISVSSLLSPKGTWRDRLVLRISFKSNLAAIIYSLVGQHYYLTLRHSTKRTQLEPLVRTYTEQYMKKWSQRENKVRSRLFKPFEPTLERWAKSLRRKAEKSKS